MAKVNKTRTVAEKTTLQTIGIGALSAGVASIQIGAQFNAGVALAVIGIVVLALKYWRN